MLATKSHVSADPQVFLVNSLHGPDLVRQVVQLCLREDRVQVAGWT